MKKNIIGLWVAILAVSMTSCLDDSKYAIDPSSTNNVIEFYDPSVPSSPLGAIYPVWTATTEIVTDFTFSQTINYAGPNDNDKDISLTLAVDQTALDAYNKQMVDELHGGTYTMMPSDYFTFTTTSVTIPKGQRKVDISITVHPNKFDLTKTFALPIRIVSASTGILSAHYSVAILAVVVKNKYDGVYSILGGSITRNSASGPDPVLGGTYVAGLTITLATVNGNTNAFPDVPPLWKDGSGVGGIAGTKLTINESTNGVTVTSGNATLKNTPATINSYDPATKTFTLNFDWGAAPNTRIVADLKLKYLKSR